MPARRRNPRFSIQTCVRLKNTSNSSSQSVAHSKDISAGGIRLLAPGDISLAQEIVGIQLGQGLALDGRLCRVDDQDQGQQEIAFEFVSKEECSSGRNLRFADVYSFEMESLRSGVLLQDERLRSLNYHLLHNIEREMTSARAASFLDMERTYFSTFFRVHAGVNFLTWLRFQRIKQSLKLIQHRNFSLSHVADLVGYRTARSFQRDFKTFTSLTPSQFKKLVQPNLSERLSQIEAGT